MIENEDVDIVPLSFYEGVDAGYYSIVKFTGCACELP